VVKLEIMGASFRHNQLEGIPLSSSDQQLLAAMIEQSDSDAATDLCDHGGGATAIDAFDRSLGMHQPPLPQVQCRRVRSSRDT